MPDKKKILDNLDWDAMVAFTAKNLKYHRDAETLHEFAVKCKAIYAAVKEVESAKDKLIKDNEGLSAEKEAFVSAVSKGRKTLGRIDFEIDEKSRDLAAINSVIMTDNITKRKELDDEIGLYRKHIDDCKCELETSHKAYCKSLDDEIKKKQGQLDSIDAKRKEMATRLSESV